MQKALFPSDFSVYSARIPLASLKLCISTNKNKSFSCKMCVECIKKYLWRQKDTLIPKWSCDNVYYFICSVSVRCVSACLCRIGRFLEELVSLQSILLGRTPCFLLGGRVISSLGRALRRPGWKTGAGWPPPGAGGVCAGPLARAGWRGRPGSVMFESDVSPWDLVLMPRGGCSWEGVGQVPGGPGCGGDAHGSWV